jgi:transposase InsO family protein
MNIKLHKNARTTPAARAEIAASTERACVLAARYGVTEATIYKWKKRDSFVDKSHTADRLQTTLSPAQEAIVVELRKTLFLPLDDLLAVTREFLCADVSRSGLDRCLRRHGVGNLHDLKPATPKEPHKAFKAYEPGYLHMDVKYLPQMADESKRSYLFVAIDRATRWVFVQIKTDKTARSASSFLKALHKACPIKIQKLLTDNGKEFTDRLFAIKEREPSGEHEFDRLCQALDIEHRLTQPRTPKTNGMVERFNGRIADVLKTNRFNSAEDMAQTLMRYVALYNHQLPQSALKSKTPMQTMKDWYASHPHLFHKRPYDRPECESQHAPGIGDERLGRGPVEETVVPSRACIHRCDIICRTALNNDDTHQGFNTCTDAKRFKRCPPPTGQNS